MYEIMFVKSKAENYESLYRFETETVDNEVRKKEFNTIEEIDAYVEDLLNNKGYAKSDFIIVEEKEYTITADLV